MISTAFLYPIAFISGILTVLSPCVLPILPIILSSGIDGKKTRVFGTIIGLVASFTFFALALSSVISGLGISADTLRLTAAAILGFFGFALLVPGFWNRIQAKLETIFHPPQQLQHKSGFGGGLITGAVLGLVWTPCVGPIIATVTTLAAIQSISLSLVLIVFTFSLGTALPLLFIALGGRYASQRLGWYRQNQDRVRKIFGFIIVITALLIASGGERAFQTWVLDTLPEAVSNPVEKFEERVGVKERLEVLEGRKDSTPRDIELDRSQKEVVNNVSLQISENGAKIPLSELLNGCPRRDCIPSIDDPQFEPVSEADWNDADRIFVMEHNGIVKLYPQLIMNQHEIVNDWFPDPITGEADQVPIAVTFCPLCGTATAFERKVNGVTTEFGVSGKLHNSDLVMYDRYEGSLWQQISGQAISGPAARRNEMVEPLFLITLKWSQARQEFPDALVLTRDTGYLRNYNVTPYLNYEQENNIYYPVGNEDSRLDRKTWIYGIEVDGRSKAYPEQTILDSGSIIDSIGTTTIEITSDKGVIRFTNQDTGELIVPLRSFWFAWAAFHPDTELY